MEQVIPKPPVKKAWPLMTPAERLAIWEEARLAWTHDAEDVIAPIERGRDEADRELPPRMPQPVYTLDTNIIIYYFNGEAPILAFLREQMEQGAPLFISAVTEHELYSYPHLTPVEVARIDALLTTLTVIDVDGPRCAASAPGAGPGPAPPTAAADTAGGDGAIVPPAHRPSGDLAGAAATREVA